MHVHLSAIAGAVANWRPLSILAGFALLLFPTSIVRAVEPLPPNVLFIAIDDLNDWVGFLGGHPQVKTPNMDRLAARGVVFANAHCAAPLCNPSRAAIFSGLQPWESGVLGNQDGDIRKVQPDCVLLPTHFRKAGYRTFGTGKLLHQKGTGGYDEEFFPEQRWSPFGAKAVNYSPAELPSKATNNPRHVVQLNGRPVVLPLNHLPSDRAPQSPGGESFDWGPVDVDDDEMGDGKIARWAAERLEKKHEKPFFLAVGFYRPHIPLFAPKQYFELYEGMDIQLPPTMEGDLEDLSPTGRQWALEAVTAGAHATVVKNDQWQDAVKGYLACVSFIDAQIGRMLDALDEGPHAANTVIVLWGDHGWHLGEKQHWGKWTGWQRSTRVPLVIVPPVDDKRFKLPARTIEPASLLDLYPTLIDLCGIAGREGLSGQSLVPQLLDPNANKGRVVISTFDSGNHAVIDSGWRYIRYADGSEELYDTHADPHEWENLAAQPKHQSRLQELSSHIPPPSSVNPPESRRKSR